MEVGGKHPKHSQQWKNSLINYVYPVFGDWPIDQVDREAVQRVLNPIWNTKTETSYPEPALLWTREHSSYPIKNRPPLSVSDQEHR